MNPSEALCSVNTSADKTHYGFKQRNKNGIKFAKADFSVVDGFLTAMWSFPGLRDRFICLCLTNLRPRASSEGISHGVTNGVSVIMTHHRCRMGSGVCLIATKAPPWSRYNNAYSSLKICGDRRKRKDSLSRSLFLRLHIRHRQQFII